MKDVEESLDDVRDDLHEVRVKTEGAVEATTLGIKPSVTDCSAYLILTFLFRTFRSVFIRDPGPLCPLRLNLSMD